MKNIKVHYFSATPSSFEGDLELTETCAIIRYADTATDKPVKVIIPLSAIWQVVVKS